MQARSLGPVCRRPSTTAGAVLASFLMAACTPPGDTPDPVNPGTGGAPATGGAGGRGGAGGSRAGTGGSGSGGSTAGSGGSAGGTGGSGGAGTGGATAGSGGSGTGGSGTGGSTAGAGGSGGASGGSGGGSGGAGGSGGGTPDAMAGDSGPGASSNFSFFVISMKALQMFSGKVNGFGGDLRNGKADGLTGADEMCRMAAEMGMPGAGAKQWRAFLSVSRGPAGTPVNARDRVGTGPWYDRNGRLLAMDLAGLFAGPRPAGDAQLVNDMTNERGEPNHRVGPNGFVASMLFDNHDTLTGSDPQGRLAPGTTCNDWTSVSAGRPNIGHSWPRSANGGRQWANDHSAPGCAPGFNSDLGPGAGDGGCVGCSGGYGGFYCFAVR
jgi:hypothetical protein